MTSPTPREVADYIAARLDELDWEVSYPSPDAPFRSSPASGDEADRDRR
jgi:hypothetical protein